MKSFLSIILLFLLFNCNDSTSNNEKEEEEQSDSTPKLEKRTMKYDPETGFISDMAYLENHQDLPECKEANENAIYWVDTEESFYACSNKAWMVIMQNNFHTRFNKEIYVQVQDAKGEEIGYTTRSSFKAVEAGKKHILLEGNLNPIFLDVTTGHIDPEFAICHYDNTECEGDCLLPINLISHIESKVAEGINGKLYSIYFSLEKKEIAPLSRVRAITDQDNKFISNCEVLSSAEIQEFSIVEDMEEENYPFELPLTFKNFSQEPTFQSLED